MKVLSLLLKVIIFISPISLWANSELDQELLKCSRLGSLSCMRFTLQNGANVMARDKQTGRTPLHWVASLRKPGIVQLRAAQLLIENLSAPEHVTTKDNKGDTPLHIVARLGKTYIAELLINKYNTPKHIMVKDQQGNTPLAQAALKGHLSTVRLLIQYLPTHEHITTKNQDGDTPLHLISDNVNRVRLARFLINKLPTEEHLAATNNILETPLHEAARAGNIDLIKLLLEKLPDAEHILAQNKWDDNTFDIAVLNANLRAARIIFGLSPNEAKEQLIKRCDKYDHFSGKKDFCGPFNNPLNEQFLYKGEIY